MKLIKPNVVILEQQPGLDGIYKQNDMMYIEKDICLSVVHSDEFDGKNNLVKDGDMITYNIIHDKNKDEYTIDSVIITPKDGEKKYLSREEFLNH